jgi:hypothetical protein
MRTDNNLNKIESGFKETWQVRDVVLKEIGMTYAEYLKSDHWKKVKQKASRRKRFCKCFKCGSTKNIDLHHKHYRFLMHIHELQSIVPLCRTCHEQTHDLAKVKDISVREATNDMLSGSNSNARRIIDDSTGIEYYSIRKYCNETGLSYKRAGEILSGKVSSRKYKIRYV